MFGRLPQVSGGDHKTNDTIVAKGVTVSGNLQSDGDIVIDGALEGTITSGGNVKIGPNANVAADVDCQSLTIDGVIQGTVVASEDVYLNQTGRLVGDVTCRQLDIALGGIIRGQVRTEDPEATPPTNDKE